MGAALIRVFALAAMHEGDEITTIEGIGQPGNLYAVQAAFGVRPMLTNAAIVHRQIMSAVALLKELWGRRIRM